MSFRWYFSKSDVQSCTPSRKDGIDMATETRYRKEGAKLIINASSNMGLRYDTQATSVVFFHRFFMLQSFKQFNRWVVAMSCLYLAGKVEETPKKGRDILKQAKTLLSEHHFAKFGSDPKEQLLTHERILLQTIKFDLQVEHPYSFILKFGKQLKGDKAKLQRIVQMAWTFVNDSLCTTLCLQWESPVIAVAFLYLAARLSKYDLQAQAACKTKSWWRQFLDTVDVHDLEEICSHVLDLYGDKEGVKEPESLIQDQQSVIAFPKGSNESSSLGPNWHSGYQHPTSISAFPSQQPTVQPGMMQIQQLVLQAQQASAAVQSQKPVMLVHQQQSNMQVVQQPNMPLVPVQQSLIPPTQQSTPAVQMQQQQAVNALSSLPLSQRITLLPTPMAGSPSSIPVTQHLVQQQQQQMLPTSTVNATHYTTTYNTLS